MQHELKELISAQRQFQTAMRTDFDRMQKQLDALDLKGYDRAVSSAPSSGLRAFMDGLDEHKSALDRHGRTRFEVPTLLMQGKSTILSTGLTSTEPSVGVQGAGRAPYRVRGLFRSVPTEQPTIGVLRTTAESLNASPQTEGQPKAESTATFQLSNVPVQTIAHFINFSRQSMDDVDGFREFIDSTLIFGLEGKAEEEILSGVGTGVHLTGLTSDAEAFDSTILSGGASSWNSVDVLGAAAVQLSEAGWSPDFAIVSPRQWFAMVSLKDSTGQYVLANPRTSMGEQAYNLRIVPSRKMSGNTFLVGDSSRAIVRQKMATTIELSRHHANNFTSNLVTALAEERFCLQILRQDAFVYGALESSPA